MTSTQIRKMVYMAFTAALTVLLAKLTRFPPFPSAPYLKPEFPRSRRCFKVPSNLSLSL